MKDNTWIECDFCGGEAEFVRDIDPWGAHYGDWKRVSHDCNYGCANHPDIDPTALYRQVEEDEVRRAESAYERQFQNYHGSSSPQTEAERREVAERDKL
jgi:hypothetical protein